MAMTVDGAAEHFVRELAAELVAPGGSAATDGDDGGPRASSSRIDPGLAPTQALAQARDAAERNARVSGQGVLGPLHAPS